MDKSKSRRDKRREIEKIFGVFGCLKAGSFEDIKNSNLLALIGCSHFYLVDSRGCGMSKSTKDIYISMEFMLRNMFVSELKNSEESPKIKDFTELTRKYNHPKGKIRGFNMDDIYHAPDDIIDKINHYMKREGGIYIDVTLQDSSIAS